MQQIEVVERLQCQRSQQQPQPCSALGLLTKTCSCLQLDLPGAEGVSARAGAERLVLHLCPGKDTVTDSSALFGYWVTELYPLSGVTAGQLWGFSVWKNI